MAKEADAAQSFPGVVSETLPKLSELGRSWTVVDGMALLENIMEVGVNPLRHAESTVAGESVQLPFECGDVIKLRGF